MDRSTHGANRRPHSGRRRARQVMALAGAITLLTSACSSLFGDDSDPADSESAADGGSLTVELTNFPHIDPQSVGFGMWLVQMGLLEGLVLQTPDGTDVRPGIAEEWEVNEDGTVYTFHLREDAAWSNGDPVTAGDFVWSYERLMNPDRGDAGIMDGSNSYQTNMGILNAEEFVNGEITEFSEVGIEEIDEHTLEFTLNAPNPGFLFGLTYPSMLPLNPGAVEGEGNWQDPENWVGNGPYNLTDWALNSSMTLERNPEYWDAENVALDTIEIQLVEQGAVTTTVPYESGEVDILTLSNPGDISRFMESPELSEQLHTVEGARKSYLAPLHSSNPLLEDPQIRTALSLGLGREEIAGISPGSEPAATLVSTQIPGWDESLAAHDPMWGDEAVAQAQQLLADAGYPGGEGFPEITVLAGSDFPEIDAIVDTWETNLGISAKKDIVEVGVYVERRAELHGDDYVGFWFGSFSGVATWPYQVEQLWGPTQTMENGLSADAYARYLDLRESDPGAASELLHAETADVAREFADLVPQVRETLDEAEQQQLYMEAAAVRERSELYIPLTAHSFVLAVQPRVEGFEARAQADRYYFKDLSVTEAG